MNVSNIHNPHEWFEVLQTTQSSQTAVMVLQPGQPAGEKPEAHGHSEQILLLVEGELTAEVNGEQATIKRGDVVIIPAGQKHRFINHSSKAAITFNVYTPPEYAPDERG